MMTQHDFRVIATGAYKAKPVRVAFVDDDTWYKRYNAWERTCREIGQALSIGHKNFNISLFMLNCYCGPADNGDTA